MGSRPAMTVVPTQDELLLVDVVDTLRHRFDAHFDPGTTMAPELLEQIRVFYRRVGMDVPDSVLAAGAVALTQGRFAYAPPRGPLAALGRLYVSRRRWGRQAGAVAIVLVLALGGYFFGYRPYEAARNAQAAHELQQVLPARIDELYRQIFDETKVQTAADQAVQLRDAGRAAALKGDRGGAEQAIGGLEALRNKLDQAYTVHIAGEGGKLGFWTFPPNNSEATNYYIIVDALDSSGKELSLPITSDDTGVTTVVNRWGLRVPQYIYEAVMAGRSDQGLGANSLIGVKQDGFLDVDYAIPVLGGTLTQW